MRISDWSSDVCSSDLKRLPVRADRGDVGGRGAAVGQRPQCGVGEGATDAHVEFGDRVERYPRRVLAELDQIGRASCRERVCQYESIAVVDVSLKKAPSSYLPCTEDPSIPTPSDNLLQHY